MDTPFPDTGSGVSFLSDCVSEQMTPDQAAEVTQQCWTDAETVLAPLLGVEGVKIVLREGEKLAALKIGEAPMTSPPESIREFSEWARALDPRKAVAACMAFFASVERYLVKLLGAPRLGRILKRSTSRGAH